MFAHPVHFTSLTAENLNVALPQVVVALGKGSEYSYEYRLIYGLHEDRGCTEQTTEGL